MSELAQTFTKKLGPFPAWAWIGIGAGVGLLYLRRKASASASTAGVPGGTLGYGGGQQLGTGNGFGGWDLGGGSGGGTGGNAWNGVLGSDAAHPIFSGGDVLVAMGDRFFTYPQAELDKLKGAPGAWTYIGLVNGVPTFTQAATPAPAIAAPTLPAGGSTHAGVAGAIAAPVATLAPRGASGAAHVPSTAPVVTEGWR